MQVRQIKASIARATTLEEIERLNTMLRTGHIPGEAPKQQQNNGNGGEFETSSVFAVSYLPFVSFSVEEMDE